MSSHGSREYHGLGEPDVRPAHGPISEKFSDNTALRAVRGYVATAAEERACERGELDRAVGTEGREAVVPARCARVLMHEIAPPSPTHMSHSISVLTNVGANFSHAAKSV